MSCAAIGACVCADSTGAGTSRTRGALNDGDSNSAMVVALSVAPGVSASSGPFSGFARQRAVSSTTDSGRLVSVCRSPAVKASTVEKAFRTRYCGRLTTRSTALRSGSVYCSVYSLFSKRNWSSRLEYFFW